MFYFITFRYAANADPKEVKEGKEKMTDGNKNGKEVEQNRSVSVMSSLSYRKRSNLKDSIGGRGDENSLFSTLKEQPDTPDHTSIRKAKSKSGDLQEDWRKSQEQEDFDDKGSVISLAYSEATSRARKGLDSRWASRSSPEFDKDSVMSYAGPSRMSKGRSAVDMDDDTKSMNSLSHSSPRSLHRSTSWRDERRSSSRLSLAHSCGLSEYGLHVDDDDDDDDDGKSMAFSEGRTSSYSPRSLSRSFSTPPQPRPSDSTLPDSSDIKPVTHRNYLDPDLEAAINEVLSFKPIKFKRSNLEESSEDENEGKGPGSEDGRKKGDNEGLGCSTSSLSRSASGSALDYTSRPLSTSSSRSRKGKKSKVSLSDSSSSDSHHSKKSSRGRKSKRSKKKSKKKRSESESSSSSSESSSSDSTISYRSSSSVKRGPKRPSDDDEKDSAGHGSSTKKETKKKQKKMDNLVMKYLYRADSD